MIHLAEPRIESYDLLFKGPDQVLAPAAYDYRKLQYLPRYSWYKKVVHIPADLKDSEAMLSILKSQYVTQVYITGKDVGQSISCYTPIDLRITQALHFGADNEILIRVGERIWLPPQAAGSTDQEKVNYIPGNWDDVFLSFSGRQKVRKCLILPSVKAGNVTVKLLVRSFYPQQIMYGRPITDKISAEIVIKKKKSGKEIARGSIEGEATRDNETQFLTEIPLEIFKEWSPENPFLYQAEIRLFDGGVLSDVFADSFGMRDFERRGKFFYLNDERYYLRGSNITLHRFFEDPDCRALPWDREWVRKMLIDDPKSIHWNAMRICVGVVPDFWYDLAGVNQMDEPHLYRAGWNLMKQENPGEWLANNPYPLGKMDDWEPGHLKYLDASAAQLVNEYSWSWLWRDGQPARLTKTVYDHILGPDATPEQRREMQAYWLACDTEWIRGERSFAGVLAFCHLTNNYGFTGDWYINNIRDLEPGISLKWLKHAFAPVAVFIDLADQRYFPNGAYVPGQQLTFNLVGVNDLKARAKGTVTTKLIDPEGKTVAQFRRSVEIPPYRRVDIPVSFALPETAGGYLVLAEFSTDGSTEVTKSRRYIKVGGDEKPAYCEVSP